MVVSLFKKGVMSKDIGKTLTGVTGRNLSDRAKELIQIALARCLYENSHLK